MEKVGKLREAGVLPYPDRFERSLTCGEAAKRSEGETGVRCAGRIVSMRKMGKLIFAHIQDISGKIQIALRKDGVGERWFALAGETLDIGDFIGVEGTVFVTRTGELTIDVADYVFLSKSLRPLPEKWHGLTDTETIYRRRYLDLIMSDHSRSKFLAKSRLIQTIRTVLLSHDFIEVETPVLQAKPSGALARPFRTYHEALNQDVYLRIAPETYLKRLLVGGFTRVFEFARCFRNEGISADHLQDFTMLEYYAAYWNYEDNMRFTEELIQSVMQDVIGTMSVVVAGETIDFSGHWPRVSFSDVIFRETGIRLEEVPAAVDVRQAIDQRGLNLETSGDEMSKLGRGHVIDLLYKKVCRPKMIQPQFLTGHPLDLSPLARSNDADPAVVDRFQLVAGGVELVNAYSELADPVDQRRRFDDQARLKAAGDDEALDVDHDFVLALEYGMPPASGWGMGIDRFMKFLFGEENIKNCVLFPLMRPEDR
ncbi:lysine--tRNA ligase [bacterium]|nr:lysine--tRNA ligase [candidate division CSSED10-310 bacterium]